MSAPGSDMASYWDTSQLSGTRIEVYWSIIKHEGTDHEEVVNVWWPGVVDTLAREEDSNEIRRSEEGQIVYWVDYEGFDEFGPERCQLSFLNQHVLRDMDQDQCMAWRTFGSSWSDVGGALAEYEAEDDVVLTASEVLERQATEIQDATGFSSVEESMTHLQATVPREKLIDGARAMNEFAELFKAHLQNAAMEEPPADGEAFVVTKDVVDAFVAQLGGNRAALS